MNPENAPKSPASSPAEDETVGRDKPALQGEGNYEAARRHRESVERFIDQGKVESAAEAAAPKNAEEERDMKAAEGAGLAHGRR